MSAPADIESERALITAALLSKQAFLDVTATISPEHFYVPKHQHIWQAIEQCAPETNDPILVAGRLRANGLEGDDYTATGLNRYYTDPSIPTTCISHARRYAHSIVNEAARRGIIMAISEGAESAQTGIDAAVARDDLISKLGQISTLVEVREPLTADDFAASVDQEFDWLVPGLFERGDRMMVTGAEGAGKSMLITQIGFMVAAGIHPWTLRPVDPIRVLVVDLENDQRKLARRVRLMRRAIDQSGRGMLEPWAPHRMRIESRNEGINLRSNVDRDWLASLCIGSDAELLVIGPRYRMSKGSPDRNDAGGEDMARSVTAAIDQLRQRCGITVLIEDHAGHGQPTGLRDLRPSGSSVWLRWPEFGFGIAQVDKDDKRAYGIGHWRGPRDDRDWPVTLLRNSSPWPWVANMG